MSNGNVRNSCSRCGTEQECLYCQALLLAQRTLGGDGVYRRERLSLTFYGLPGSRKQRNPNDSGPQMQLIVPLCLEQITPNVTLYCPVDTDQARTVQHVFLLAWKYASVLQILL